MPTSVPAPAAPTGLNTSGITQTSITLSWTQSTGATFYEVRRGTTGAFTTLGNVSTHIFTGLSAGTAYTLQVRAGNTGGTSATAQVSASTNNVPPPPAPAAPTGLSTSGITQTSIPLSWTKSSGATYYEVRRGTTGGFTRLGNVSTHIFTGLSAGTAYTLQVRAGNTGGTSATAQVSASTNNVPPPPAPAMPTGLSASGITQNGITLSWTQSAGATFYEVRRGTTGGFTRLGNVSTHIFTGLSANTAYILQVRAGNTGGTSATAQVSASTNNVPPPSAPAMPTGLSTSGITQNSIPLSWTQSNGATYYEVRRGTTGGFTRLGNVSTHIFTGLNAGTAYTLQVRAGNTGGTSATAQVSASTAASAQNAPPVDPPPAVDDPPAQDSGDKHRSSSSSPQAMPTGVPTPQPTQGFYQSLNNLTPGIEVNNWAMGTQGRRVGALGVGNQAIIDQGLLDAIDMWGYIPPGTEVCFAQFGRLVLLDAAYSPRREMPLAAYQRDGMTCATIDRAGTVVLLRSAAPLPASQDLAPPLQNCMVYLQYALNFRAAPNGNIMSILPAFIWLTALDYREGWFKVDYHGQQGWINADYVEARGDCGLE